jgi:uncharacterized protein YndB with AHSA1/START domain
MFDVASIIADHQRTLGRRETEEGEAYVLRLNHHYDAAVEDVWEACTDPGRIGRWFLPITGDLRLGGSYQLEGNAGGRIKGCEPPRRLAVTRELGGGTSDLTLTLSPGADGGTDFELEHVAVLPFTEEQYLDGIGGMAPGWEDALAGLDSHLSGDLFESPATRWYEPGSEEEVERRWNALGRIWRDLARAMFAKT